MRSFKGAWDLNETEQTLELPISFVFKIMHLYSCQMKDLLQ